MIYSDTEVYLFNRGVTTSIMLYPQATNVYMRKLLCFTRSTIHLRNSGLLSLFNSEADLPGKELI